MPQARSRPATRRWIAPVLLIGITGGLAPLWWQVTAPPHIAAARPWRTAGGMLMVPVEAVRPSGSGVRVLEPYGHGVVFVIDRDVARTVRVELGAVSPKAVEIRGGLDERAQIAANPPRGLEDRHRVVVAAQ